MNFLFRNNALFPAVFGPERHPAATGPDRCRRSPGPFVRPGSGRIADDEAKVV